MTVESTTNKKSYTANGIADTFVYDFLVFDADHMFVYLDGVEYVGNITVLGLGEQAGGTVQLADVPADQVGVTLYREVPALQESDYEPYTDFPAGQIERDYDLGIMVDQQLSEAQTRTMTANIGSDPAVDYELPAPEADKVMMWASDGLSIINGPEADDITNAQGHADDAALSALEAAASALAAALSAALAATNTLVGEMRMFSGPAEPATWLFCTGQAVDRVVYATLFALIGETYGVGDGATTFNVPDLRGRTPIGVGTGDAADATAHALAGKEGAETHLLLETEIPAHSHPTTGVVDNTGAFPLLGTGGGGVSNDTGLAGGDGAHNNMQPSLAINFIIYAGV